MTWFLIRLNFGQNPAHFGEVGIGIEEVSERVHSDTLFSAWVSAYAKLFYQTVQPQETSPPKLPVESLLERFPIAREYKEANSQQLSEDSLSEPLNEKLKAPPFRLSSTFVYRWDGTQYIDYVPKPLKRPVGYPKDDLSFAKEYKKLNYLPLSVWRRWYQGEGFTDSDRRSLEAKVVDKLDRDDPLKKSGALDYSKAFAFSQVPKVALDRVHQASNFYTTGLVQFRSDTSERSGLYFLIQIEEEERSSKLLSNLQSALVFLGEEGLGGERSSGAGQFEVAEWSEIQESASDKCWLEDWWKAIHFDAAALRHSLLSLFWDEALALEQSKIINHSARYALQERGGWIGATAGHQLRRQMVKMFTEGSVFAQQPQGKLADVTHSGFKRHRIYRSGIGLSLPIISDSSS